MSACFSQDPSRPPGSSLPTNHDHALHVMGASTLAEVTDLLSRWTLDGVAERVALEGGAPKSDAIHRAAQHRGVF